MERDSSPPPCECRRLGCGSRRRKTLVRWPARRLCSQRVSAVIVSAASNSELRDGVAMKTTSSASKRLLVLLLVAAVCALGVGAQPDPAKEKRLRWFREAKFGLFIHWGLYAIPAGEWKGK